MKDKFDWHNSDLGIDTIISIDYRNTQNVRRFFKKQMGSDIRFSRSFMAWMKANTGKTLGDAIEELRKNTDH